MWELDIQNIQSPEYSLERLMLNLKLQYFGHLMQRTDSLEKTLMLGKIEGGRGRGKQDEMVGWHHRLKGHEFERALGVGDGQGSLACCSPWCRKELDTTDWLNWTALILSVHPTLSSPHSMFHRESRRMVLMNLFAGQEYRYRCQT